MFPNKFRNVLVAQALFLYVSKVPHMFPAQVTLIRCFPFLGCKLFPGGLTFSGIFHPTGIPTRGGNRESSDASDCVQKIV